MQAFIEGKTIQFQNCEGRWQDDTTFDTERHPGIPYRIRPEPKEYYIRREGAAVIAFTKQEFESDVFTPTERKDFALFREVLPGGVS